MIVLLDNGHGAETPGKRSPDGRLQEYAYARGIARRVENALDTAGVECRRITPEEHDVNLNERVRRVNEICREYGKENVLLVSIHCNAAGNGASWMTARGWSAYVSLNASEDSKELAVSLFKEAENLGAKVRKYSLKAPYWPLDLAICRDTMCPAVLTENFFQDNRKDVELLLSESGKRLVTDIHVKGIMEYLGRR